MTTPELQSQIFDPMSELFIQICRPMGFAPQITSSRTRISDEKIRQLGAEPGGGGVKTTMKLLHKISCADKHFEIGAARWVVKENRDPSGGIFCKCGRNDCLSQDLDLLLIRRDQDADGWNSGPRRVDDFEFG